MNEATELLEKQITEEIRKLSVMEDGSEEKTATINGIDRLYRLHIDEKRMEAEFKSKEIEESNHKQDRIIGYIIDGASIGLPLAFYWIWMGRGFRFEQEGVYKSRTFQALTKFFKPTRR